MPPTSSHAAFTPFAAPRSPWRVLCAVWHALFLREATLRLSETRAAWFWLIAEPVAHLGFMFLAFSTFRHHITMPGIDFGIFLVLGICGFFVFRNPARRAVGALSASAALFAYRHVKPVDTVIVRCVLEGILQSFATLTILALVSLFGYAVIPADPLLFLTAFFILWLAGLGLGLILSILSGIIPELGKIIGMLFLPLYFASGVMFMPAAAAPEIREWLLLNPILHGIETLRAAFYPQYHLLPEISLLYLVKANIVMVFLGLLLHVRFARKVIEQ